MPKEFTLSKPIKVHGQNGVEDTNKVTLQDPPSSLIFEYGMPFSFVQLPDDYGRPRMGGEDNRVNGPIMQRWLSRLSGLDPGVLGQIAPRDMQPMMRWVGAQLTDVGEGEEAVTKNSEG